MGIDVISKCFSVLLLGCMLAGCISGPVNGRYSIGTLKEAPKNGYGVVFGKICEAPGFEIRNTNSGEKIWYIGGLSLFALQLPEGEYELYSMGSPSMMSDAPYKFRVVSNKVFYVGTVIKSWSIYNKVPKRFRCDGEALHVVSVKQYGFSPYFYGIQLRKKVNGDFPAYLSNYVNGVLPAVKKRYPHFSFSNYETKLMY